MEKTVFSENQRVLQQLLRELREGAGLRQADVAQELERPQSFVSKIETGERRLDVLELREVCRVLKISLADFVKRLEARLGD